MVIIERAGEGRGRARERLSETEKEMKEKKKICLMWIEQHVVLIIQYTITCNVYTNQESETKNDED